MIRLALLRHGHTAWNREGRIQGRTDMPLDAEAIATLSRLRLPKDWDAADLVASPLSRARHTAELVGGRRPRTEPALTEMDWGAWEGRQAQELAADPNADFRPIDDWGWDFAPPGGESLSQMKDRLTRWQGTLARDTLAVCHIGTMRVLLALATGWHFDGPAPFRIKRNRLFILEGAGDRWQLLPDPIRLMEAKE